MTQFDNAKPTRATILVHANDCDVIHRSKRTLFECEKKIEARRQRS